MAARWTWPVGLSLNARVTLLEEALYKHFEDCAADREQNSAMNEQMLRRLDEQGVEVQRLHRENQASNAKTLEAVQQLQGSTATFDQLLPSIKSGIEADAKREFRRKGAQRVMLAVLSTLVTVSALIPIVQLVAGVRVTFHFVGSPL